jgi:hypothetical protein
MVIMNSVFGVLLNLMSSKVFIHLKKMHVLRIEVTKANIRPKLYVKIEWMSS